MMKINTYQIMIQFKINLFKITNCNINIQFNIIKDKLYKGQNMEDLEALLLKINKIKII
jgi:hypothetical protein